MHRRNPSRGRLRAFCSASRRRSPATETRRLRGAAAAPAAAAAGKININQATAAQLALLPRIGEKVAERIVEYRKDHGDFARPEDLMEVKGIGEKLFLTLKPYVTVSGPTTVTEKIRSGASRGRSRGAAAKKPAASTAPGGQGTVNTPPARGRSSGPGPPLAAAGLSAVELVGALADSPSRSRAAAGAGVNHLRVGRVDPIGAPRKSAPRSTARGRTRSRRQSTSG